MKRQLDEMRDGGGHYETSGSVDGEVVALIIVLGADSRGFR